MSDSGQHDVTHLLRRWASGEEAALHELIEVVYPELRRIASRYLQGRSGQTLQSTALVHEAYLRLAGRQPMDWTDRSHFFAVAARIIRGILVDHYRAQHAGKRGGETGKEPLSESIPAPAGSDVIDLLDLDAALHELERLDPQQARIVELRYFAGLSIEETAHVLNISPATVKRDWLVAKAWIRRRLTAAPQAGQTET